MTRARKVKSAKGLVVVEAGRNPLDEGGYIFVYLKEPEEFSDRVYETYEVEVMLGKKRSKKP